MQPSLQEAAFCIDIDNTIASTDEVMRKVISEFSNCRVRLQYEDITAFNYYDCRDMNGNQITIPDWKQIHERFSEPRYLWQIAPSPGAVEGIRRLAERASIHLATSRIRKARATTAEWLDAHGFPSHELHFLRHGEKHTRLRTFAAVVEDDYEQAVAFANNGTRPCILIRHPWNRSQPETAGVEWVDSWDELTERLLKLVPSTKGDNGDGGSP